MFKRKLTSKQIEKLGWIKYYPTKYIKDNIVSFIKDNYILRFDTVIGVLIIGAKDITKIDWLGWIPESFRITIPCKYYSDFKTINKLLPLINV